MDKMARLNSLSDRPLQPIRCRESPVTRDSAWTDLGQNVPSTSAPASKYSKAVNNVVESKAKQNKNQSAWGLCKADLWYPERQAGGVRLIPFPKCQNKGKCFKRNETCGWPQEYLNVNRVDYNFHFVQCFDQCAFVRAYDFLQ